MERDRNLLFGILGVQTKLITPSQLVAAAALWAADSSRGLPEYLVEQGNLKPEDRDLIQGLVDRAVEAHDGDAAATLTRFGGEEEVYSSFVGSIVLTESGGVTAPSEGRNLTDSSSVPGVDETPGRYTRESEHARGGMGRVLLRMRSSTVSLRGHKGDGCR